MKSNSGRQSLFGAFWAIELLLVAITIMYMMLKGILTTDNPYIVAVGTVMMFFAITGAVFLDKFKVKHVTMEVQCLAYGIGAIVTTAFLGITQPFTTTSKWHFLVMGSESGMQIMSSIRGSLSVFEDMWITTQAAATVEELFFLIVMPLSLFMLMDAVARTNKKLEFLKHPAIQIIATIPPTAIMFAYIHVGLAASAGFFMMAVVFRTILIGLVYGDMRLKLVPFAMIVPAFALGVHRYWNIATATGGNILGSYIPVMASDPLGYLSLGVQALYALIAIQYLLKRFKVI